jgi:soluble lytic murein transglycosylase-like protein
MMSADSNGPRIGRWLLVAGLLACRPASVNEAAQRVHPAVNIIQGPVATPTPAAATPVAATPAAVAMIVESPETDPAALLAAGHAEAAVAALPESLAAAGSPEWFVHWALRGRAERLRGRPDLAVAALAPLVAARETPPGLPRELLADEYARSLIAAAVGLPAGEADPLREQAAEVWRKALKLEPVRNLAVMRVAHAEALAAIEGEGAGRRAAATRAVKALTEVLRSYPEHPRAGALELARAQALQRAGKAKESLAALRRVAIDRTGTPEAEAAEAALTGAGRPPRWSAADQLERASAARKIRQFDVSRALLDALLQDPGTPAHLRPQALRSRAYTAKKQRDFVQSAADLEQLFKATPSAELRHDYLQALDRARRYDDAIALWLGNADKRGGTGKAALSGAIEQAIRGGCYAQAKTLLERLPAKDRLRGDRPWQDAWLKFRLGEREAAIAAFAALEKRARSEQAIVARYFRGRLMLELPESRAEGVVLLREVIAAGPFDYYGLQARQRLLDVGEDAGPTPVLSPMSSETATAPGPAQARATFAALAARHGAAIPALRRGEFLFAAGWLDEAQRELRIAVDSLEMIGALGKPGWTPKHEDHVRGLAWLATWKQPKLSVPREARKLLREPGAVAELRDGLRTLCWALGEPHRMARLTPTSAGSYRSRWHPRAFRATVEREAKLREVDPTQLWSLMYTESRFRRHAVSSVGARGAIQIMPNTGELLAARLGETLSDTDLLFDIDTNVHLAAYYLDELLVKFHGQAAMAYASYNGGPFNVERWLAAKADRGGGGQPLELDVFIAEIPLRETANYTRRVLEVQAAYNLMYRGELPRWTNAVDPQAEANIDF